MPRPPLLASEFLYRETDETFISHSALKFLIEARIAANRRNAQKSTGPNHPPWTRRLQPERPQNRHLRIIAGGQADLDQLTAEFYADHPPVTASPSSLAAVVTRGADKAPL